MANRGWSGQESGESWPSNARTTGRTSGTQGAEAFVQGSKIGHPSGGDNDPMDQRSDLQEAPGNLSVP